MRLQRFLRRTDKDPRQIFRSRRTMDWRSGLSGFTRLAGRANKFTKSGNIGTVSFDAGVIELGQAKPNGWKHALDSARVHRARRSVTLPRTICNCEELVPIVFVPHFSLLRPRDSRRSRHEMHQTPLWSLPPPKQRAGLRYTSQAQPGPA